MTAVASRVTHAANGGPPITAPEFDALSRWLYDNAGIHMTPAKQPLVTSRLSRRLRDLELGTFTEYLRRLGSDSEERQVALDLLTTNETYFFREPRHFQFLKALLPQLPAQPPVRIWSAACSSGEEPYSIAMTLSEVLPHRPWEVLGTDISRRVLEAARTGHYKLERARDIPPALLSRYCLKGTGPQTGTLLVSRTLRSRVKFEPVNLNAPLPDFGTFDVIFLRNVMIYFDEPTKREVIARMLPLLRPDGHFIIGHSESLNGITTALRPLAPSIYRRV
ncbi:CheR family methyltransferase [Lysobacter korlensis]|uniref:Chemotaxis protein methyltransferase n=1 Tax=Lysobacter korlensis TaxID=553636 RepID=A0ABV6RVJ9_9GAMM